MRRHSMSVLGLFGVFVFTATAQADITGLDAARTIASGGVNFFMVDGQCVARTPDGIPVRPRRPIPVSSCRVTGVQYQWVTHAERGPLCMAMSAEGTPRDEAGPNLCSGFFTYRWVNGVCRPFAPNNAVARGRGAYGAIAGAAYRDEVAGPNLCGGFRSYRRADGACRMYNPDGTPQMATPGMWWSPTDERPLVHATAPDHFCTQEHPVWEGAHCVLRHGVTGEVRRLPERQRSRCGDLVYAWVDGICTAYTQGNTSVGSADPHLCLREEERGDSSSGQGRRGEGADD